MTPQKIFYQSSMPRAGSTLLQNVLAQNPAFYATPTSGVLELIFGARINYSNGAEFKAQDATLMRSAFYAFCREGMRGYYGALTDKPYVLDKSRGWGAHYALLRKIFDEEPKIVCMVRDLRAVVASMEKKFRGAPDQHQPIENHAQLSGNTTYKRAVAALNAPPVGLALDRLLEIHQRGWAERMLFVRFEDFCARPDQALQQVYAYLGVPPFRHDFDNVEQLTQEDDAVFGIRGLHDIRPQVRPIEDDFLDVLGAPTVRMLEEQWGWFFQRFGYARIGR